MQKIPLTKHVPWSYEREWRHFRPLNQVCDVIDAQPFSILLFEISHNAFRSVTFGARIDTSLRASVIAKIRQAGCFQHLRLFDAALKEDEYGLVFQETDG